MVTEKAARTNGPTEKACGPMPRPHGQTAQPDRPTSKPAGTVDKPDGTVSSQDGPMSHHNGPAPKPQGPAPDPAGPAPDPEDTAPNPRGTAPRREGTAPGHEGPVKTPGGTAENPGGTASEPRGTATDPAPGEPPGAGSWEQLAGAVPDPELPVVTLAELGVLRRVAEPEPGRLLVELTPTYTGCPAVEAMAADIERVLTGAGAARVEVRTVLTPPWSSDDISAEGRRKLAEHGVAPPRAGARSRGPVPLTLSATRRTSGGPGGVGGRPATRRTLPGEEPVRCPRCGSAETRLLSRFSSTACKALRRCESCLEPFDHFKEV